MQTPCVRIYLRFAVDEEAYVMFYFLILLFESLNLGLVKSWTLGRRLIMCYYITDCRLNFNGDLPEPRAPEISDFLA
jgi:hypothetical protein